VALPPGALTPLPSAVPAPPEAKLELLALAMEKDRRDEPIQPRSEFPPGEHDVLLFFHYDGMSDGIQVTFAWYREGELIDQCSDTWLWGQDDGRDWGEVGWTSYVCTPATGWEPGNYEIRVFIETRLQGVAQYVVTES